MYITDWKTSVDSNLIWKSIELISLSFFIDTWAIFGSKKGQTSVLHPLLSNLQINKKFNASVVEIYCGYSQKNLADVLIFPIKQFHSYNRAHKFFLLVWTGFAAYH